MLLLEKNLYIMLKIRDSKFILRKIDARRANKIEKQIRLHYINHDSARNPIELV